VGGNTGNTGNHLLTCVTYKIEPKMFFPMAQPFFVSELPMPNAGEDDHRGTSLKRNGHPPLGPPQTFMNTATAAMCAHPPSLRLRRRG
jgi:hypothetical protein